jgi:hypothetical protein
MGAIQDEQLALDQNGLSNHGAARPDQATGRTLFSSSLSHKYFPGRFFINNPVERFFSAARLSSAGSSFGEPLNHEVHRDPTCKPLVKNVAPCHDSQIGASL